MKVTLLIILILACLVLMGASCKEIATVMMGGAVLKSGPLDPNKQGIPAESGEPAVNQPETKPSLFDIIKALNPINTYKTFMGTELKMVPLKELPEGSLNTPDTSDTPGTLKIQDSRGGYQIISTEDGEQIRYSVPSN